MRKLLFAFLILALMSGCSGVVTKHYLDQRFTEYATKQWVEDRLANFQAKIESRGYVTSQEVIELMSQLESAQAIPSGEVEKLLALLEQTGANKIRAFTDNAGGAAGEMDAISCNSLATNDLGLVFRVSDKTILFYLYNNDDSCEADTDPYLIAPDDCATCTYKGQWELFKSFTFAGDDPSTLSFKASDQANQVIAKIQADATDASDSTVIFQVEKNTALATQFTMDGVNDRVAFTDTVGLTSGANPTTAIAGDIAIDTDDHFIEFYSDASRAVGALYCETFSIVEPDTVRGITDDVILKHFPAEAYPHGVTIKDIFISVSESYTSETFLFEEWTTRAGGTQNTIESIAVTGQTGEDDGTLTQATIAADGYLNVNLDDTPEDVAEVEITITYWITPGD